MPVLYMIHLNLGPFFLDVTEKVGMWDSFLFGKHKPTYHLVWFPFTLDRIHRINIKINSCTLKQSSHTNVFHTEISTTCILCFMLPSTPTYKTYNKKYERRKIRLNTLRLLFFPQFSIHNKAKYKERNNDEEILQFPVYYWYKFLLYFSNLYDKFPFRRWPQHRIDLGWIGAVQHKKMP